MDENLAERIEVSHDFLLQGLPAARAAVAGAPEPRAIGPGPNAERLRGAYLDLLKLCLCDLTGTSTGSVGAVPGGTVVSRELRGEQRRLRSAGMDWPLQGLTMVGLRRLEDLQSCVESVVRDGVEGDLIEAGAWRGGASILMRATLDALGSDDRTVWVADSFQGFPVAQEVDPDAVDFTYDFLAVPLEEVEESFARLGCERGVRFVPGFFEETLPGLSDGRWAVVRLDGDTYEATQSALRSLYPGLSAGGYLIVDDYGVVEGCRQAVDEFRREHGITEPLEEVDWMSVRWRRESMAPVVTRPAAPTGQEPPEERRPRPADRPRDRHVPTLRELELMREVAELRGRLAAADGDTGGMQSSAVGAVVRRMRATLSRGA